MDIVEVGSTKLGGTAPLTKNSMSWALSQKHQHFYEK